jgi:hypothetical protein
MAYTTVDKVSPMLKQEFNKRAEKNHFPAKTDRAKALIKKVGLPTQIEKEKS